MSECRHQFEDVGYLCRECGEFRGDPILHTVLCELADRRLAGALRAALQAAAEYRTSKTLKGGEQ